MVAPSEARPPLVLTLDIGTSSLRAMLFDSRGRALADHWAQISYEMRTTPDGGVESDAEVLLARAEEAIDAVLARAGSLAGRIAVVGTSTFWHTLVGVAGDRAVTPLYTWADTRAAGAAARLRQRLDERAVHARTGCVIHPSYLPARLLWLAEQQPALFAAAERWMSFGEYLHLRWLGQTLCSVGMASGTGLLDQNTRTWDAEVLAALPITVGQLSPLGDLDTPLRGLRPPYARRWPALAEIPWLPALGDGACSNIGCGATTPDRAAVMVGTSTALRVVVPAEQVTIPPGLWCYHVDRRRFVLGGADSNGGNLVHWLLETLRLEPEVLTGSELAGRPADGHGLTMLPFLAGERSPGWNAAARAAIVGLSLHSTPLDILQAALEAVAYRFALMFARLCQALAPPTTIIASGGALLRSPAWMQIIADVLGQPLVASAEPEASSRGAALLALEAIGALSGLEAAPAGLGAHFLPDPGRHERYQAAIARQQQLYALLVGSRP